MKEQTQILPADQQLLYENMTFSPHFVTAETEGQAYPATSMLHPVYLYCDPRKLTPIASKLEEQVLRKYFVCIFNPKWDMH